MMMNAFGAEVFASPSNQTSAGRKILEEDPDNKGALGIAISEAVEDSLESEKTGKKPTTPSAASLTTCVYTKLLKV